MGPTPALSLLGPQWGAPVFDAFHSAEWDALLEEVKGVLLK